MNLASSPRCDRGGWIRVTLLVALIAVVLVPLLLAAGLLACFLPGGEVKALRRCITHSSPGGLERRIEFAVRPFVLTLARAGLSLADIPDEARAALRAVRGVEIGIYELPGGRAGGNPAAVLPQADAAMARRGWERVVGIVDGQNVVAVFTPREVRSAEDVRFAVLVFERSQVVVASVRGNLEPLAKLALKEMRRHAPPRLASGQW